MSALSKTYSKKIMDAEGGLSHEQVETMLENLIDDAVELVIAPVAHELQNDIDNCCGDAEEAETCESFGCAYLMKIKDRLENPK